MKMSGLTEEQLFRLLTKGGADDPPPLSEVPANVSSNGGEPDSRTASYTVRGVSKGVCRYARVVVRARSLARDEDPGVSVKTDGKGFVGQGYAVSIPADGFDEWRRAALDGAGWALARADFRQVVVVTEVEGMVGDTRAVDVFAAAAVATLESLGSKASRHFSDIYLAVDSLEGSHGKDGGAK